jgi:hypothetical protein
VLTAATVLLSQWALPPVRLSVRVDLPRAPPLVLF